jgi:Alpha-glucosidases, family 31 of glycosyl hydrolases
MQKKSRYTLSDMVLATQISPTPIWLYLLLLFLKEKIWKYLNVKNTGDVDGEEVAQLYVSFPQSKVVRPIKQLKGFNRISIKKGESKTFEFTLSADDLAYWDNDKKLVCNRTRNSESLDRVIFGRYQADKRNTTKITNLRPMKIRIILCLIICFSTQLAAQQKRILGEPIDMSIDFKDFHNTFFFADKVASFNGAEGKGKISWKRTSLYTRQAFNVNTILPQDLKMLDFPGEAYEQNPELDFSVDFVTPRTLRIRMLTTPVQPKPFDSPMLVKEPGKDSSWKYSKTGNTHTYKSNYGSIEIEENPFRITLKDEKGKRLTDTWRWCDNDSSQVKVIPFNFIKRGLDNSRAINPVFSLSPGRKIFGCGESVTKLDKEVKKVNLFVTDPQGPETDQMYKPVPFFMSNRGYGMFMHTSAPVTCDFGNTYVGANKLFMGDEALDLFIFIGEPKDILNEYTEIVGKPSMPPLWSFGTWMSRITYFEQSEGYDVAAKLRSYKIPSDVIHFDTGWFETDWQCDYKFAPSRFSNPQKMIDDLKKDGFHIRCGN